MLRWMCPVHPAGGYPLPPVARVIQRASFDGWDDLRGHLEAVATYGTFGAVPKAVMCVHSGTR